MILKKQEHDWGGVLLARRLKRYVSVLKNTQG
jgi:hypothetical protein